MEDEWYAVAKQLKPGQKTRIKCCNQNSTMVVSNGHRGYSGYCFRCGSSPFKPHGLKSIGFYRELEASKKFNEEADIQIPKDFILATEMPDAACLWLLQYGITLETAASYGIGYSPSQNRVVMPVYYDGKLTCIQARAVDNQQKPKYLNKEHVGGHSMFYAHNLNTSNYIVVTEDILSAIKVGGVAKACSILGTNMTGIKAMRLAAEYDCVVIWLDGDEAGRAGAKKAQTELMMQGLEDVYIICTDLDPKELNHGTIKRQLEATLNARSNRVPIR